MFPYQGTQSDISESYLGLVTDNKQVSLTSLQNKHFLAHTSNDEFLFVRMMYIEKKRGQVHNFFHSQIQKYINVPFCTPGFSLTITFFLFLIRVVKMKIQITHSHM